MPYPEVPDAQVQAVLQSVTEARRLSTVVKLMAREIERLQEENMQLLAAVGMYREACEACKANVGKFHQVKVTSPSRKHDRPR